MMKDFKKHRPPRPGEAIGAEIKQRGYSISQVARSLGVSASSLTRLINGKAALSAAMAVKIGIIGLEDPFTLMLLQRDFDLWEARQSVDRSKLTPLPGTEERRYFEGDF